MAVRVFKKMKERKHGLGLKSRRTPKNFDSGREGEIRTHDQQFIRLPLLPAELLPKEKGLSVPPLRPVYLYRATLRSP